MTELQSSPAPVTTVERGSPPRPVGRLTMAAVVAFFVLVGHVWSVSTGLFLDDHAHYANLRRGDWSFRSAVGAAELRIVGGAMDLWGRPPNGLRFFRPVAFWVMRAEYTITGWRPMGVHFFSLGWHFLCAMLVGELAMRCMGQRIWATVAASLMAVHPGHMVTVYWIACQTELLTTAFLAIGILAYSRAAGWGWSDSAGEIRPWFLSVRGYPQSKPERMVPISAAGPRGRVALLLVAVVSYGLALGCRENALLFPLVCWLGDRLCGTNRRRWLRWEHFAMVGVAVGYFALRIHMLAGMSLPTRPYIHSMSEPGFARYVIDKSIYYAQGLFGYVPVVVSARETYFAAHPVAFYGGFVVVVALLLVIWRAYGFPRAMLWPCAWTALLVAPVMPVFASSHHLYLPSVGAVLLITAGLAALGGLVRRKPGPVPRPQVVVCAIVLAAHGFGLSLATWALGFAYDCGTRIEDIVVQEILRRSPPLRDGDHLFFINYPILAHYAMPAIETATGRKNLHGHVLTFSTDLLRLKATSGVEIVGDRAVRVRAPAGSAYLEGITGATLFEILDLPGLPPAGVPIPAGLFTVTPTKVTPQGVEEMIFTFEKPVRSPDYHFYFGSPQFLAYPLDLLRPPVQSRPASEPGVRTEN